MDPDELVEWQRANPQGYELLDLVQGYIRQKEGRVGYKKRIYTCIRSFFRHNRAGLPDDPDFRIDSEKPMIVGTLSIDEFRRILASCNPTYRAIFLSMFQGGMSVGELLYWSENGLGAVRKQIDGRIHPLRIDLPGRKRARNKRPYYTFIGRDAVDALKTYLRGRSDPGCDDIFLTQFRQPVSYRSLYGYWMLKLRRLGLIEQKGSSQGNRYGKNLHEIRDLFRSRWRPSGADTEVAEFFMGHNIDKLGYDKSPWVYPQWFEDQYLMAEPWLNIVSEDPEVVPVRDYNRVARKLEETEMELRELLELKRTLDIPGLLATLKQLNEKAAAEL